MGQASIKKNTIYNAIKTLSSIVFPLITFPYVSRVLLPDNVGKVNFGLSVVSYFGLVASLGIATYAIRECSAVRDDKKRLSDVASQIFSINIVTTCVAYIALFITLCVYHKLDGYRTLILIQSLSIVATTFGADWLNSAMEDFKYITIRTVLFQILSLVLMFCFIHRPQDYLKFAVVSLISSVGASVINIRYRRKYCRVRMIWNLKTGIDWKKHMKPVLLLFVMLLAQNIYANVDITMLGLMCGDREVGIYTTGRKIAALLYQVIVSIAWVVMPRMSYYFKEGKLEEANALYRKVYAFFMLVGMPSLIGISMLANDAVRIAAGTEYNGAEAVLIIVVLGFVFDLFGASLMGNIVFLSSGEERKYMIICCGTAVVNIITNYFMIPIFGANGAAATTVLCNAIMFFLFIVLRDRRIRLKQIGNITVVPLVGCAMIVLACFMTQSISNMWIRISASILVSIFVFVVVQFIGKNELFMELWTGLKSKMARVNGK